MQSAAEFKLSPFVGSEQVRPRVRLFVIAVIVSVFASAALASLAPLQVSIVTVFLFAGPHNWFELRYFLMRLPVRFGKSRNFFLTAFGGLGLLAVTYCALPFLYQRIVWSNDAWLTTLAIWNSGLLLWLSVLVWLRSRQRPRSDWTWFFPLALMSGALNWLSPEVFSLSLVYLHPLVALWFLDKHLQRTRPTWVATYRRCLAVIPVLIGLMIWQLSSTRSLAEDNGLFWRITQHSGANLLPNVSSHLLVSVHLFLEMLHYGVWLLALPLLGPQIVGNRNESNSYAHFWDPKSVPIFRHARGFPRMVAFMLVVGVALVVMLWVGFSVDYATTRDIYFTIAITHVMAEAPFLLRNCRGGPR